MTSQEPRKMAVGLSSRSARDLRNVAVPIPRRMAASYDVAFEKPPTKKNTGITWNTHVASQSPDVTPTAE